MCNISEFFTETVSGNNIIITRIYGALGIGFLFVMGCYRHIAPMGLWSLSGGQCHTEEDKDLCNRGLRHGLHTTANGWSRGYNRRCRHAAPTIICLKNMYDYMYINMYKQGAVACRIILNGMKKESGE